MPVASPRTWQQDSRPGLTLIFHGFTCRQTGTRDCLYWPALPHSRTAAGVQIIFLESFFIERSAGKRRIEYGDTELYEIGRADGSARPYSSSILDGYIVEHKQRYARHAEESLNK